MPVKTKWKVKHPETIDAIFAVKLCALAREAVTLCCRRCGGGYDGPRKDMCGGCGAWRIQEKIKAIEKQL